ncbi:MAG: protein-tyrosine-phosphatase [Saprospiraceae bacterium]
MDTASVPAARKALLQPLADYIWMQVASGGVARLTFICTHNSRRSHLAQLWAAAAAKYCVVGPVACFSGGTEVTACNPRTLAALTRAGVQAQAITAGDNPVYLLSYADGVNPLVAFSKLYDQAPNPKTAFAAVMTCSDAEENCPFIPGAEQRFPIAYEDPKAFDDTPGETAGYDACCRQIATEMLWVFQRV